jgi:hypothetical protein
MPAEVVGPRHHSQTMRVQAERYLVQGVELDVALFEAEAGFDLGLDRRQQRPGHKCIRFLSRHEWLRVSDSEATGTSDIGG